MKNDREVRVFTVDGIEIRKDSDQPIELTGHAAVFNKLSLDLGGFRERIKRNAFKDTIKDDDPRGIWNHNNDVVLGRQGNNTLELREDRTGLAFKLLPPDTQLVRDMVLAPIERGDVTQMSFGFRTIEDSWSTVDGEEIRELRKVTLIEISPVTFPAYPDTDVAQRSLEAHLAKRHEGLDALDIRRRRLDLDSIET
jgi:HK97 family phage prohead protease